MPSKSLIVIEYTGNGQHSSLDANSLNLHNIPEVPVHWERTCSQSLFLKSGKAVARGFAIVGIFLPCEDEQNIQEEREKLGKNL